jgi:hypothetical protein
MRIRTILIAAITASFSLTVNSQYYNTGQDPASLKWMQVKTGRFNVIFPENYSQGGINFARALDKAYSDLNVLFPGKNFRIPVIIHNYTTQANGYVSWAPKRMEIYPTPEENKIPLDTYRQLALHELTHVMQVESLNSGFSRVMTIFFGQQFTGAITSLLPLWYIEGHAVFAETALSGSGRGRSPSFQNELRAIAVEKGKAYKYDKMLNGSFRDYTPDYYQFGYQMVAWSLAKNDPQLWNKVLNFTANEPFTLNPVNLSLRRNAGLTKKFLYSETFDTLKSLWENDIKKSGAIKYEQLNPGKKGKYINYHSPVYAGNDSIIAVRISLSDPAEFVLIRPSEKTERRIHVPGDHYPWFISFAKGKIVWVETQSDLRWNNRNYSVIKLKDINSGVTKQLTYISRYLSASISPDGKVIAATENTTENKNNLILLNADDGKVISSQPSPENSPLQRPQWSGDGNQITVIYLTEEGEGVMSWNMANNQWKVYISPSTDDLHSSFLRNDSLFYISSASGTDNIYLLTPGKEIKSVTSSIFGISDMIVQGAMVVFSDYTSSGNDICISSLKNISTVTSQKTQKSSYLINRFDIKPGPQSEVTEKTYSPTPYRKWQHLFGFHSWMPFYADLEAIQSDPSSIRPGATIMSQNQLSTLTTSLGYEYSANKRHVFHSKITWKGWYPVIESRLDYGQESLLQIQGDSLPATLNPGLKFINTVSLPLTFTPGRFSQTLYLALTSDYKNQYVYSTDRKIYDYGQTNITSRFYFSNYYKYAFRDINPRWAQIIDLTYTSAPFDKLIYGTDLAFKSIFFSPGLLKNHSIKIRYEREKLDFAALLTSNRIHFPRSYENIISKNLSFVSIDYAAPLFYPDFNIGSFLYLTRIRIGLFYDYAEGTGNTHLILQDGRMVVGQRVNGTETFRSFGMELVSDMYLLRVPFPVSFGVQAAWKSFGEAPSLNLLFNIDIYGMNIGRSRL